MLSFYKNLTAIQATGSSYDSIFMRVMLFFYKSIFLATACIY